MKGNSDHLHQYYIINYTILYLNTVKTFIFFNFKLFFQIPASDLNLKKRILET